MNKEPEFIKEKIKDLAVVYKEKEKEKVKSRKMSIS